MYSDGSSGCEDTQIVKNFTLFCAIREKEVTQQTKIANISHSLKDGANINAQNERKKTLLHIAIEKEYIDIVKFLLIEGIRTDIPNRDNRTALDLANDLDKQNIVQILQAHNHKELKRKVTRKRKSTTSANAQSGSKQARYSGEDDEDDEHPMSSKETDSNCSKPNTYPKGGLVHSLHGNIYQLKLQMLFLKRALDKGYEFNLGTEVEDAEKFDDIVFKYRSGKDKIRFVQAKHKQDESKEITARDLLTEKDDDFSLQKYFISYRKLKKKFTNEELENFVLCTNITFDFNSLEEALVETEPVQESDDILDVSKSDESTARYKLIIPKNHELYQKLKETSDVHLLAKQLAKHISENRTIELRDIILLFHVPLSQIFFFEETKEKKDKNKEVVKKYAIFRNNFLKNDGLSPEVLNFRKVLMLALGKDDNSFQQMLNEKKLNVSRNFGVKLELEENPKITDPKKLAKAITDQFKDSNSLGDTITLRKAGVVKDNIAKLAGHILVQDEREEDKTDLIRFREVFFENGHNLPGNLNDFREELKTALENKNMDFNTLRQNKYKINDFKTCKETSEGDLLISNDALPNDKIEDEEIEQFLEKLVFAVDQPNEVELGDIITKELGVSSQFNLLSADLVADSFQRKMLDWFKAKGKEKGKEGIFLNATKGKEFFSSIEEKVNILISVGLSTAYPEVLQEYGIRFNTLELFEKLQIFLCKESKKRYFYIIAPAETILSAINVYNVLEVLKKEEKFVQYDKNDSYIFMRLSTLLLQKTRKRVIDAFKSKYSYNLLIIHCEFAASGKYADRHTKILYDDLHKISLQTNKKIIFITDEDNSFVGHFTKVLRYTDNISSSDLILESKEKLLEKEVKFQGKMVTLKKLYFNMGNDNQQLDAQLNLQLNIDPKTLVKLIKNDEVVIGSKLNDLGEVKGYYINRKLRQITLSKEKIKNDLRKSESKSDLFIITGTDSGLEKIDNIFVFKDTKLASRKFEELCKVNTRSNIHWLKSDPKKLTWYKSYGSISDLVRYRIEKIDEIDNTTYSCWIEENKLINERNHHKIVIISDTAGMGKSTILTSLSMGLKTDSSLWIIRINLNDYTKVLNKELNNRTYSDQDINKVVNFLVNSLLASQEQTKLKTDFERELFNHAFYNHGKIALLFDGFDEISPDYNDIVIDLLQSLGKSKVRKLVVTTRPNMSENLERALGVFSHVLQPLSKREQIEFLVEFWTKMLKPDNLQQNECQQYTKRLNTYADSIIEQISKSINDKEQEFIGIPLQTKMLAEVFQENQEGIISTWQSCKEFLESEHTKPNLPKNFALLDLYKHFVKIKFYNCYLQEKKGRDFTKVGETKSADKGYEIYKVNHGILALHTIFNRKDLKKLLSQDETQNLNSLIKDIKNAEHNEGIVDQIINGKPHFIHRTFADYFASFSIIKKMLTAPADTLQCIDNILLNTSPIFINNIIEQLDGEQGEIISALLGKPLLHFVITQNHLNFIESVLKSGSKDWAKKLDASYKTPLHYAIEYDHDNIIEKLLKYANDINEDNILKHGSFMKSEYENSELVKFINSQDKFGKTALYYAVEKNNVDIAFELLLKGASIDSLTDNDTKKLICEMLNGTTMEWSDIYNTGILGVYANQKNKYRPIQEKLFLKRPKIFKKLSSKDKSRILSYFFVHGRIQVIKALLESIDDLEVRKKVLNNDDNGMTPLDRVNYSDHLSDDNRLEITNYLLEHGCTTTKTVGVGFCDKNSNYITQILQAAAQNGHIKTFENFINQENYNNYYKHLYLAIQHNRHEIIKYLCKNHKEKVNKDGNTALHTACDSSANLNIIKYLIDSGDCINAKNNNGETPLFMSIYACSGLNIIEYLVTKGADINIEDKKYNTPLSCAIKSEKVEIINYLLEKGARISKHAPDLIKNIVALFKEPADNSLDLVDENGFPRLHSAIKCSNFEWTKFLVRHVTDINKEDRQGKTPLHWASELKQVEIVELLLQYGALFDKSDNNGNTPRDLLSESYNGTKIIWLLDVLHKLFHCQNLLEGLNEQLLDSPSDRLKDWGPYGSGHPDAWDGDNPTLFILNAHNAQGKTLLHIAADTDDTSSIYILFKFNRDYLERKKESLRFRRYRDYQPISIDTRDIQGNTPLHLAARKGYYRVVSLLLEKGAIFNSKNFQNQTPEVLAESNNHSSIADLFIQIKILFIAIKEKNTSNVKNCIKNHAEYIHVRNQCGETALHLSASLDQPNVVQELLSKGADTEAIDLSNNTPIHIAAKSDKIENIKLLLQYGAIYNGKNTHNKRPLDLAPVHTQSYRLLEQLDTLFKVIQSDNPEMISNNLKEIDNISTIINARDNQSNTLLHYAAKFDEFNIVKLLLENGAIFNAPNKFNKTPEELANYQNITTLLKTIGNMFRSVCNVYQNQEIVSTKIITNVKNDYKGQGLLHHAVASNDLDMVKFLVDNDADVNLKDRNSETALDLARDDEIINLLHRHKARTVTDNESDDSDSSTSSINASICSMSDSGSSNSYSCKNLFTLKCTEQAELTTKSCKDWQKAGSSKMSDR